MKARIAAFLVWALAAAGAVYWALRLLAAPAGLPPSVETVSMDGALKGDIARLFAAPTPLPGAAPVVAEPALASRFKLIGVVAARDPGRGGVALLAVDGKPPRPYRVGASFGDDIVLQQVEPRSVALGPVSGPAALRLDLPALPPPATGRPGAPAALPGGVTLPGAVLPRGTIAPTQPPAGAGMQPGEGSAPDPEEQVEPEPPADDEPAEAEPPVPGRRLPR